MKEFDNEFVKTRLSYHYEKRKKTDRKLHITPIYNTYSKLGTIVFSLDGSPPKGFGIFKIHLRNHGELWLYDAWGKRFKIYDDAYYIEPEFLGNVYQLKWARIEEYKKDNFYNNPVKKSYLK